MEQDWREVGSFWCRCRVSSLSICWFTSCWRGNMKHLLTSVISSTSGGRLDAEGLHWAGPVTEGHGPAGGALLPDLTVCTRGYAPLICTYLRANQPPASLCSLPPLLLFHTHGCHVLFCTRKTSEQPRLQLSYGPRLHLRYASTYPNTKEALGLWFPFGPCFVKQSRVLCFLSNWFRGLMVRGWTPVESTQTCKGWATSKMTSDLLSRSLLCMSWG